MPKVVPLPDRRALTAGANVVELDLDKAWRLYDRQARFVHDSHLFALFLAGVGSGKSHALTAWVIRRALANPGTVGALLGRTSLDLATVLLPNLFDRLQEMQDQCGQNFIRDYDKGNAKLTLINGTVIYFRPYNRISKLRGLTLTFAGADEVEWSEAEPEEVWSVMSGRLRGPGPSPGLAFATSPNGLRGITKRFVDAQRSFLTARNSGDIAGTEYWAKFHVVTATSYANPYLPEHFFDSLRSMSKRRFQQEVEGKVLRPQHSVYQLEARHIVPWDWREWPSLPRVYGVDWGTDSGFAACMAHVLPTGRWIVADELVADECTREQFQSKLHAWIDGHGLTPPAMIGVDRAVPIENNILAKRYRGTRVAWMESREDQKVMTGVSMLQDAFDPLDGEPMLVVSDRLAQTFQGRTAPVIPALRGYEYHLDAEGVPTARPRANTVYTHMCDALRYAFHGSANRPELHGGRSLWTRAPVVTSARRQ